MSSKIVVICENETLDRYVIKPVLERMFQEHGKPRPRIYWESAGNVEAALAAETLATAFQRGRDASAFFLMIDRDCDRKSYVERAAAQAQRAAEAGRTLFACLAVQEVEVWALGLHRRRLEVAWETVREECDPKEAYFEPFARSERWLQTGVGKGRVAAMRELSDSNAWNRLKAACPELHALSQQVGEWLNATAS